MLWANDTLGRAFGPESSAVVNRPFVELLDPYDRPPAVRELTRLDAVGDEVAFEARLHPVAGGFRATWSWRVGRDGLLYILGIEADPEPRSRRASRPVRPSSTSSSPSTTSPAPPAVGPSRTRSTASSSAAGARASRCRWPSSTSTASSTTTTPTATSPVTSAWSPWRGRCSGARPARASWSVASAATSSSSCGRASTSRTAVRNAERLRETVRVLDLRLAERTGAGQRERRRHHRRAHRVDDGRVARARRRPGHVRGQGPRRRRHRSGSPTPWSRTTPTPPPRFPSLAPWTSHGAGS